VHTLQFAFLREGRFHYSGRLSAACLLSFARLTAGTPRPTDGVTVVGENLPPIISARGQRGTQGNDANDGVAAGGYRSGSRRAGQTRQAPLPSKHITQSVCLEEDEAD
jgi:hypothetical protein